MRQISQADFPRGPAISQITNPMMGSSKISTVQTTFGPVDLALWKILTMAHTSAIKTSNPKMPPISIPMIHYSFGWGLTAWKLMLQWSWVSISEG
jgi:hypothetical protein